MGGTSGALYGLFFSAMSASFQQPDQMKLHRQLWLEAFKSGCDAIELYGRSSLGERTMLDPLKMSQIQLTTLHPDSPIREWFETMAETCESVAVTTKQMIPKSGRASYSFNPNSEAKTYKYPDSGAHAVGILSRAISEAAKTVFL